jgi:hypothetical protein
MARLSRHTLSYCNLCETDIVICADCGNNCCNGGTGEVDGARCGCSEAYEDQDAYWKNPDCVRFAKDIRESIPRIPPSLERALKQPDGRSGRS